MKYKDYDVTLTLRVHIPVTFSRENDNELALISKADAIDNAIASLPYGKFGKQLFDPDEWAEEGWAISLPIEGEAVEA